MAPYIIAITSLISGIVFYIIKDMNARVTRLETSDRITETQTRQIISDKLDPVKEDIAEIKSKVDTIFDMVCNISSEHRKINGRAR